MPAKDRVWSDDRRQLEQGLATNGLSFHSQQSTLVIVEEQSLATELLQQSIDLSILELDDLLLTLVDEAADGRKQNVPRLEQEESPWLTTRRGLVVVQPPKVMSSTASDPLKRFPP